MWEDGGGESQMRVTRGVKGNFGEQWIYFCYLDCGEGFTVS